MCIVTIITAMFYGLSPMVAEQDSVYRTYAPLVEVDALIRRRFVGSLKPRSLTDGAIRGMLLELDPYSGYVVPDDMPAFLRRNTGRYVGIGVEVGMLDGRVCVIAPIEGGPAQRAGIRAGDVLIDIDGTHVEDVSAFEVESLLTGWPGSRAAVTIERPDGSIVEITVPRAEVLRHAVTGLHAGDREPNYFLDPLDHIAYVRVTRFADGMVREFNRALSMISKRNPAGLIIDLRFNPGGLLTQAVLQVDRFVAAGTIVSTINRRKAVEIFRATSEGTITDLPLVVLIDGASASSSEIVAGALQDHGRAVVVGERSFGKGSVQSFFELQGGEAGVKLTVAFYQLPGGRIIHKTPANAHTDEWGVIPDVVVTLTDAEREALLRSRMVAEPEAPSSDDGLDQPERPQNNASRNWYARLDRQLQAAVDVITALPAPAADTESR